MSDDEKLSTKLIRATKPEMASYEEYIAEISSIWDEGIMTNNGPKVQKFKKKLVSYMNCKNAEVFVNGHSAILIGIKALNLPVGSEVLTSPFTFISTTNAIIQCGLVPVFCDIDETYNISIESIKKNITLNTSAIIAPHIFGIPCHVKEIAEIAKQYDLKVIYDAAQAFGTKIDGINIGCFGDISMFSLHAVKVFNAIEGGVLTYIDPKLRDKMELYRNFGISYGDSQDVLLDGFNAKMTEFSAAMGLINLPYLDKNIEKRKKLVEYYIAAFSEIPGIVTYNYQKNIDYNYAYFPVMIEKEKIGKSRDEISAELRKSGIQTRKLYETLTCDYTFYCRKGYRRDTKFAEEIAMKCIDFPLYTDLKIQDINKIQHEIWRIVN